MFKIQLDMNQKNLRRNQKTFFQIFFNHFFFTKSSLLSSTYEICIQFWFYKPIYPPSKNFNSSNQKSRDYLHGLKSIAQGLKCFGKILGDLQKIPNSFRIFMVSLSVLFKDEKMLFFMLFSFGAKTEVQNCGKCPKFSFSLLIRSK